MTGYFYGILASIAVWCAEDADHDFVDDLLSRSERCDMSVMNGVGCNSIATHRT